MPRGKPRTKRAGKALVSKERTHSEDGVDLTLIRWMLSLTPLERLRVLERHLASVQRLRGDKT
jgi:hypothetical protein